MAQEYLLRLNVGVVSLQGDSDFCLLLALPCGRDQDDVINQTQALKAAFINYLQAKLAAGIINIPNPGSNQVRLDTFVKDFNVWVYCSVICSALGLHGPDKVLYSHLRLI